MQMNGIRRVQDKVVIITGGARGMGASHARLLLNEGAMVVIGDVLDDAGSALVSELGSSASYIHLDVTSPTDWAAAVAHAVQHFGGVDVLINNAGIANSSTIVEFPLDVWERTLNINLTGTFLGMKNVIPTLIARGGGSIINVSSVEGLRGSAGLHAYVASKFAVRGITKSVALEVATHGIRVNSIHPGFIATDMTKGIDSAVLQIPMGRSAQSSEVSNLVLFLASDESSYSTGSEFVIDGGLTAGVPHR